MKPYRIAAMTLLGTVALGLAGCPLGMERHDERNRGQNSSRGQHDDGRNSSGDTHRPADDDRRPPDDGSRPH
jgi:hypothetical protein